jgi:hypothetical protein
VSPALKNLAIPFRIYSPAPAIANGGRFNTMLVGCAGLTASTEE